MIINEHVGRVNTGSEAVSVAHMIAPANWDEPCLPAFAPNAANRED